MGYLNSFRIVVLLTVFAVLCYVDWSPSTNQRVARSPIKRNVKVYDECNTEGNLAITFDEGPLKSTSDVLTTLKGANITATFHVVPSYLKINKEIGKKIVEYGHVVGLRLEPSIKADELSEKELTEELKNEADTVKSILGVDPKFLRLPYGLESNEKVLSVADELGFVVTFWQIDLSDGSKAANELITAYETKLNDSYDAQLKIKPKFIDRNQENLPGVTEAWKTIVTKLNGYQVNPVTLDKCLDISSPYRGSSNSNNSTNNDSKDGSNKVTAFSFISIITIISAIIALF